MTPQHLAFTFGWTSWSSILAGVITAFALSIVLAILGVALGFTVVKPKSDEPASGLGTAFGVWSGVSVILSMAGGGLITGMLSGMRGAEHGFLVWAVVTLIAVLCGESALAFGIRGVGSALKSLGSSAVGMVSTVGKGTMHATSTAMQSLQDNINLHVDTDQLNDQVKSVIKDTGIETLQPEYLRDQLREARGDVRKAVRQVSLNPSNAEAIITDLMEKEKERIAALTQSIDKDAAVNGLMSARNIPREEAQTLVDNAINAYDRTLTKAKETLADAREQIQDMKEHMTEMAQDAREKADEMTKTGAKAALAVAIALIVAAAITMGAAHCGTYYSGHGFVIAQQADTITIVK